MSEYDLTYLSLGAGVQSSALLVCSALGLHGVPKADFAVFADTQDEPAWVYGHLERLTAWAIRHDMPVHVTSAGRLSDEFRKKGGVHIPAFIQSGGKPAITMRTCTDRFKIRPIEGFVREHLGVAFGSGKTPWGEGMVVRVLKGISLDEVQRMTVSKSGWTEFVYPLVDAGLRRGDCLRILGKHGFSEVKRSACVYCPFHSDRFWYDLKVKYPIEWDRAVGVDDQLRSVFRDDTLKGDVYLHRSLRPLWAVDFSAQSDQTDLFTNECEGMCGV